MKGVKMETKEKIVQTALCLFLENGFHNVAMSHIAKKVGISKPAIYHHFKNKDEMIDAVLDFFTEKMSLWSKNYFRECKSSKDFFKKSFQAIPIFKNVENILLDSNENTVFKYSYNEFLMTLAKYSPKYKERISQDTVKTRFFSSNLIKNAQQFGEIRDDISADDLALLEHSIIEGMAFIGEIDSDFDIDLASEKLFNLFWRLIKK